MSAYLQDVCEGLRTKTDAMYPHGLWNGHPTHLVCFGVQLAPRKVRHHVGGTHLVCRESSRGIERDDAFIRPLRILLT